jgi:thimet oligopeptidase
MSRYLELTPDEIRDGVDAAIEQAEEVLSELIEVSAERDFENTLRPLDRIADIISHADHDFFFMGSVHPDKEVRTAAKESEEKITKWASDIFFRDDLYTAIRAYAETDGAKALEGEHARLLDHTLRDLRRAGHELDPETRDRVKNLTQREIELGVRFQQNIDEWDDWILATRDELEGLPDSWIDGLDVDEETGKYKVTIAYPHLIPFLENSPRRELREQLRFKFNSVAIEENRKILEEAIALRQEIAEAFGLPTWAHHRLELRMAKTPERVKEMYDRLREPLAAKGLEEKAVVAALLEADTGDTEVQGWDWSYYDTQQRKTDYGVDNFEVAEYFPLQQVLDGMFELTSEMFGITFEEITDFDTWHDDVQLYAMHEADTGEEIARFYLDLFPREGKYGHAAEFPLIRSRLLEDGTYQNPVCAMVANFTKPTKDQPSLLQHGEVETLFHEFGHVLHQNLGRTELARFSGTSRTGHATLSGVAE